MAVPWAAVALPWMTTDDHCNYNILPSMTVEFPWVNHGTAMTYPWTTIELPWATMALPWMTMDYHVNDNTLPRITVALPWVTMAITTYDHE